MDADRPTPAEKTVIRNSKFNRREVRALGRRATAGRGRVRRTAAVRHPLATPVVNGRVLRP